MIEHKHLIIRAEVEKPFTKENIDDVGMWLENLVKKINMKVISGPHVAYADKAGNKGITACILIETSHCIIHIWDEPNPALIQFDVYTCSSLNLQDVFDAMKVFKPIKIEYKFLDREKELKLI